MSRIAAILIVLGIAVSGCGPVASLSTGAAQATAVAGGCWPLGARQPQPPATPRATLTPRVQEAGPPPATATIGATARPSATARVIYPTCTPGPLTPTVPPLPTDTPLPYRAPTPQPPAAIGAARELTDPIGMVAERGLSWAYSTKADGPVIAWVAYGWRPDEATDGQVWVMARTRGIWGQPQTVNGLPVVRNYGRVAVAASPDGTLRLHYGAGNPEAESALYEVVSADGGRTWSQPAVIGAGSAQDLIADAQGGWHALTIGPKAFDDQLRYGYRPVGGDWQWTAIASAGREYLADLALLEIGGQITPWVVTTRGGTPDWAEAHLDVYAGSLTGAWRPVDVPQPPVFADGNVPPTIRPQILAVGRGAGLVAVAWSYYGKPTIVATISTDGGQTFGPSELIAQSDAGGQISPDADYGVEPSLAYDPEADMLLASWVAIATDAGEVYPGPVRSLLALRPLNAPAGAPWVHALTPQTLDQQRPVLAVQERAYLMATPDGAQAGLLIIDQRNYQWRLTYRDLSLPALTTIAES